MDQLVKKRGVLKGTLTKISTFLDKLDESNYEVEAVENKLERLTKAWASFEEVHLEIVLLCVDQDEMVQHEAENEAFEDKYDTMKIKLIQLIKKKQMNFNQQQPGSSSSTSNQQTGFMAGVKLPKIDLPSFSGDYQDWTSFFDQFVASVHHNNKLSGSQKLNYLKSSLKGDASKLLKSVTITDANYDLAWKILKERYDNKRNIINAHLKILFNLPVCNQESGLQLRKLLDSTVENVRALNVLGLPTDQWDAVLVYLLSSKMDSETRRQWELSFESTNMSTYDECVKFMSKRCNALEIIGNTKQKMSCKSNNGNAESETSTASFQVSSGNKCCFMCKENHFLYQCAKFGQLNHKQKLEVLRQNKLCFNCFKPGHDAQDCKAGSCKKCSKKHHTQIHLEPQRKPVHIVETESSENVLQTSFSQKEVSTNLTKQTQVLLSTVVVKIMDNSGNFQSCRALLDDGSQATLISEACVQRLGLIRRKAKLSISGISTSNAGNVRGLVHFELHSNISSFKIGAEAYILQKLTRRLPNYEIEERNWPHIKNISLADPMYYNPGDIDILIGKDIHPFVVLDGKIRGAPGTPVAFSTEFGWALGGPVTSTISPREITTSHLSVDLDNQLQKFWNIEEVISSTPPQSQEEKECESHFHSTHTRDANGRFIVHLPFKKDIPDLGESRSSAVIRLKQMERRLAQNPHRKTQYQEFMKEYLDLGDMELVPTQETQKEDSKLFYLPHHAVINEASTTTKLRVVFDASKKSISSISLNDKLMVSPTLQQDIVSIILRFRTHKIAFTADIAKMYRQIRVASKDLDFQRIVWRDSPELPIQDYRLLTVTYGTASAPYQATKCLQQLANDERLNFPLAAEVTLQDFYMDDLMSGSSDKDTALELQQQIIGLMKSGGFQLRKWTSNSEDLLESLPPDYRETQIPLEVGKEKTVKALGLHWNPASDDFQFKVQLSEGASVITKRGLLSEVAKIFDPLGWLAPVVITA